MEDETDNKRRFTLDRILLTGVLIFQVAILVGLFWQPEKREPPLPSPAEPTALPMGPQPLRMAGVGEPESEPDGAGWMPEAGRGRTPPGAPGPAGMLFRRSEEMRARMDAAFRETMRDFERMDSWFAGAVRRPDGPFPQPSIDMVENPDAYMIISSLPGIEAGHVSVMLAGRTLTLAATQYGGGATHRRVREFQRTFRFPGPVVNDQSASAWVSNGVLRVVIPKAREEQPARTVLRLM